MRYLLLLPVLFACASLPASKQAQLDRFECQAKALAPSVEPVFDSVDLLRDLYAGRADLSSVLQALESTQADVAELRDRLQACEPAPVAPGAVVEG